ncbi:MAG: undecaprenyl phosphate translocase family protein [Clostridia bacterium]
MNFLLNFIKGIFVGVANIIPGVSGGTITVILRIFDRLISSINSLFTDFRKVFYTCYPSDWGLW